jgi:hypothetical protein
MALNFARLESITRALKPIHQNGRNFHATFVYNKNKLICIAHNDYAKIHPYHKFGKYQSKYDDVTYNPGIHSECSALIKMGMEDCSDLTFINIRIDNRDLAAISKPCINCQHILDQVGYKKLWYFNGTCYVKYAKEH